MTVKDYEMSVVLSATTGIMLTHTKAGDCGGLKDLASHLNVSPDHLPQAVFAQHPELNVDTSAVTNWESWKQDMINRFGPTLKFDGRGD